MYSSYIGIGIYIVTIGQVKCLRHLVNVVWNIVFVLGIPFERILIFVRAHVNEHSICLYLKSLPVLTQFLLNES